VGFKIVHDDGSDLWVTYLYPRGISSRICEAEKQAGIPQWFYDMDTKPESFDCMQDRIL